MSYSTIRRIRAVLNINGMADAVALAQAYGIREPAEFTLWILAKPGQSVKVRK